jgi:hypothetical protein
MAGFTLEHAQVYEQLGMAEERKGIHAVAY